jgi:hypothetical protein
MLFIFSTILLAYVILATVFAILSRHATVMERKEGQKRFDALGREY